MLIFSMMSCRFVRLRQNLGFKAWGRGRKKRQNGLPFGWQGPGSNRLVHTVFYFAEEGCSDTAVTSTGGDEGSHRGASLNDSLTAPDDDIHHAGGGKRAFDFNLFLFYTKKPHTDADF